jgi:hypothetical protein
MIDFDDVHRRYWRDQRGNRDAEIPVRGGDFIERDGQRYAVLFDVDRKMVAAYAEGHRNVLNGLGAEIDAKSKSRLGVAAPLQPQPVEGGGDADPKVS